ncbi:hypothetical protein Acf1_00006 [Acidovorax phage ACF1]|nr:hypothetical protein Acf1_00006 [Acidovorax phage ACF1]
MLGYAQITKTQFYKEGGFSNTSLVRRMRGNSWQYFRKL